jgi:hypothetical protein
LFFAIVLTCLTASRDLQPSPTFTADHVSGPLWPRETARALSGHSHIPRAVRAGETSVVNPGSVGLPAYEYDDPYPHEMETGAPDARYAILERRGAEWCAELVAVPYSYGDAVRQAGCRGREDWAVALRTGFARAE